MDLGRRFAKRVFLLAGIYGIVVLLPQYCVEWALDLPAPIAQPEHFYGFIGVALSWQFAFLLIARDVRRYRPLMLMGVLEKLSFGLAVMILHVADRVSAGVLGAGVIDLALGALFVLAFVSSRDRAPAASFQVERLRHQGAPTDSRARNSLL
jgi:hypothetical protein